MVGCNSNGSYFLGPYDFSDFDDAEALLVGREFRVVVKGSLGQILASSQLPLQESTKPRFFFSDHQGCPRDYYNIDDDIYLSGRDATSGPAGTGLYFVRRAGSVSSEGVIQEIRPPFTRTPQTIPSGLATGDWTALLWLGQESISGAYGAIVRTQGVIDFQLKGGDVGVGILDGKGAGDGITIQITCDESC